MGYPMTYQRVIKRNRLEGDYGTRMSGMNTKPYDREMLKEFNPEVDRIEVLLSHASMLGKEIDSLNSRWGVFMGDLRRLEQDAVDENAICAQIASRTGIENSVVAAVLKEFLAI